MQANDVTIWIWHFRWRRLSLNLRVKMFVISLLLPPLSDHEIWFSRILYIRVLELACLRLDLIPWDQNQGRKVYVSEYILINREIMKKWPIQCKNNRWKTYRFSSLKSIHQAIADRSLLPITGHFRTKWKATFQAMRHLNIKQWSASFVIGYFYTSFPLTYCRTWPWKINLVVQMWLM